MGVITYPCRNLDASLVNFCKRNPLHHKARWSIVYPLTHWARVTHICVSKVTIIGSDNGLSPGRRQAIIWTNAGILLIGTLGTHFSEIFIEIYTFSFTKMHVKMSSRKWRPSCPGPNVLTYAHSCVVLVVVMAELLVDPCALFTNNIRSDSNGTWLVVPVN